LLSRDGNGDSLHRSLDGGGSRYILELLLLLWRVALMVLRIALRHILLNRSLRRSILLGWWRLLLDGL